MIRVNIENGNIRYGREQLAREIRSAKDGQYAIELKEWSDSRSNAQNRLMHKMFSVYANEIGYSDAEAKELLKKHFGINRVIRNKRTGKQELIVRSTAKYNVDEMTEFLSRLLRHFEVDCGIIIDPEVRKQYRIDELTGEIEEI